MYNDSMSFSEKDALITEKELLDLSALIQPSQDWKSSLDQFVHQLRKVIIFDNLVVYQTDFGSHRLEVIYARALGRGRSAEADSNWGESIAPLVAQEQKIHLEQPSIFAENDRINTPCLLGIPLLAGERLPGSLILVRFGGPSFTSRDQEIARFAARQINSLVAMKIVSEMDQMLEDQRMAARLQEEFIHTISHELRSPLGFIKGYVTTLLREDIQWDKKTQTDFLNIIDRETNHLEDLFDNLLDSARLQSGQLKFDLQAVRVDSLIRDEVKRAQLNNPDLKVTFDFGAEVPPIQADPRRLTQVFDNLLSNSLKYAPGSPVQFKIEHDSRCMTIYYSNSGPGIPEPYLSRIFTRFYRTPDQALKSHGTGLGLYICKQIIEKHQGTLTVASPQEGGVLFTLTLPMPDSQETKSE